MMIITTMVVVMMVIGDYHDHDHDVWCMVYDVSEFSTFVSKGTYS